jgi:hypothetical protein
MICAGNIKISATSLTSLSPIIFQTMDDLLGLKMFSSRFSKDNYAIAPI